MMTTSTTTAYTAHALEQARANTQGQALASAGTAASSANLESIRQTAVDFEAMFLSQMFNHMFSGIKTDGLFGGGAGEDTWRSMMVDEYGKATARAGGVGIADQVMRSLLAAQEDASRAALSDSETAR